jgi:hypothetical protein
VTITRALIGAVPAVLLCSLPVLAQTSPAKGPSEDIKVHGHWVIEVHNGDGSLASRQEFENSLAAHGQELLAAILAKATVSNWYIYLVDTVGGQSPCVNDFGVNGCAINTPERGSGKDAYPNLQLTLPLDAATGTPTGTLQLSGYAVVSNPAAVSYFSLVGTGIDVLLPGKTPQTLFSTLFTSHAIARVAVTPNQIINVIVTFSFS